MEEQHDLAKWLDGKMTAEELAAFEKSPEFESYQKIQRYSADLKAPDFDSDKMYRSIVPKAEEKTESALNWQLFAKIAAVFLIGFFATKMLLRTTEKAENGEKVVFNLPDDSEVVLNAGSKINYKKWSWDKKRSLQLDGEAFFKVTKGKTFAVETELGTVTVVGTQFNVKARDEQFEVQCYEGKVRVEHGGKTELLTKGRTLSVESNQMAKHGQIAISKPTWLGNQLSFELENWNAVAAEIERQYDVNIDLGGETKSQFTGTLPSDNLDMALQILAETFHLKYVKDKSKITFTAK